jgi:alginate O-acetyltransferase complex protein AlgI
MVFTSPLFLFAFLPVFLALYALLPARLSNPTTLLASFLFYAWGEPIFVVLALGSALLDLGIVRLMAATAGARRRRWLVGIGVAANLGLLGYFKYATFTAGIGRSLLATVLGISLPPIFAISLPIGVSFIVFEKITYIVDVYRGVGAPARRVRDYLLYVFLFPKLLAGPIVKYHDIAGQLTARSRRLDDWAEGFTRFVFGMAKKVLVADTMAELADLAFAKDGGPIGFRLAWIGAIAFSLQIYFDFSGYSDMAIGLARILGFRLRENFDRPYLAVGFGEFWRRWHISLSTWIRDYLYLPLGGNRVTTFRLYVNLWICFLASGLWHGAAWTFVVWGAYQGLFLTLERLFLRRALASLPRALGAVLTFLAVTVGWVLFRAPDLASAARYLAAMTRPGLPGRFAIVTLDQWCAMAIGLLICALPALPPVERLRGRTAWIPQALTVRMAAAFPLLLFTAGKVMTVTYNPFLYFRF